jgi:hypothetical protein
MNKSKCSKVQSEMLYFYDLEKSGTFGVPHCILCDTGAELFKAHKSGTAPIKPGQVASLSIYNSICTTKLSDPCPAQFDVEIQVLMT